MQEMNASESSNDNLSNLPPASLPQTKNGLENEIEQLDHYTSDRQDGDGPIDQSGNKINMNSERLIVDFDRSKEVLPPTVV
jgi:hypothetical protein